MFVRLFTRSRAADNLTIILLLLGLERQDNKRGGQIWATDHGQHNILRERLARWLGHCDGNRSQQALHWQVQERTRLTKSELEERTVNKDLRKMWFTGEEADVAAVF